MKREKITYVTLVPFMRSVAPVLGAEVGVGAEEGDDDDGEEGGVPGGEQRGLEPGEAEAGLVPAADQPRQQRALVLAANRGQAAVVEEGVQQHLRRVLLVLQDRLRLE